MKRLYFFLVLLASPAVAQSISTGNEFLENCAVMEKQVEKLNVAELGNLDYCDGYINGFIQGVLSSGGTSYGRSLRCVPTSVTTSQLGRIVLKYIREHPAESHKHVTWQITMALSSAYPCSVKTG